MACTSASSIQVRDFARSEARPTYWSSPTHDRTDTVFCSTWTRRWPAAFRNKAMRASMPAGWVLTRRAPAPSWRPGERRF